MGVEYNKLHLEMCCNITWIMNKIKKEDKRWLTCMVPKHGHNKRACWVLLLFFKRKKHAFMGEASTTNTHSYSQCTIAVIRIANGQQDSRPCVTSMANATPIETVERFELNPKLLIFSVVHNFVGTNKIRKHTVRGVNRTEELDRGRENLPNWSCLCCGRWQFFQLLIPVDPCSFAAAARTLLPLRNDQPFMGLASSCLNLQLNIDHCQELPKARP